MAKAMSVADPPAVCGHRAVVERREENRRDQHAARCGQHRKDGPARGRKLPADDLALDLKPHGKEENHHQPVVDELLDGHAPRENPVDHTVRGMDHQREVGLQQVVVIEFGRGEIGQQHGGDHAHQQHHASGPGRFQEEIGRAHV